MTLTSPTAYRIGDGVIRVAIYARYSSDLQSLTSIEDQLRICRERADQQHWTVVDTYSDAAISGASLILRSGLQTLLQDAQRRKFDIVLAEALDRLSRDQADMASVFKHLQFLRVRLITLAEGDIDALHIGFKGTMNAVFLKDLRGKVRRGLRGRVENGKAGGGLVGRFIYIEGYKCLSLTRADWVVNCQSAVA